MRAENDSRGWKSHNTRRTARRGGRGTKPPPDLRDKMESVTDYQTGLLIGLWLGLLFGIAGTAGVALLLSCKPKPPSARA